MNPYVQLIVITGPMFSGETTELYRYLNRLHVTQHNVICITHGLNHRHENNTTYNNDHLNEPLQVYHVLDLESFRSTPEYKKATVVGIDEGQLFPDLLPNVLHMVEKDRKTVIVSGINLDLWCWLIDVYN